MNNALRTAFVRLFGSLLLGAVAALAHAAQAQVLVSDVRVWDSPDSTRVVFDLSKPADYRLFELDNPPRVVIDVTAAQVRQGLKPELGAEGRLSDLRVGRRDDGTRFVLDLAASVQPRSFLMTPNEHYGHRLVVDLEDPASRLLPTAPTPVQARAFTVVIDPGHGGEDPGAIGPRGTREKHVALQIAQRLAKRINATPGMRAELTRDGDYFIPLRERIRIAHGHQADLFVSVHADAFTRSSAHGSSVYTLSEGGASSEAARLLAKRENAADLVGGVEVQASDGTLIEVLLDLSQNAAIEGSQRLAQHILTGLGGMTRLHKRTVQQAGFAVLKSPQIPSVLVETAFISNPTEEQRLRDSGHQEKLAAALFRAIQRYQKEYAGLQQALPSPQPLPKSLPDALPGVVQELADGTKHVVERGDTLSELSIRYGVPVERLRAANPALGGMLRVGEELSIPLLAQGS